MNTAPEDDGKLNDKRIVVVCEICHDKMLSPVTAPCGHSYCAGCLKMTFDAQASRAVARKCPVCKTKMQGVADRLRPSLALKLLLHETGMLNTSGVDPAEVMRMRLGRQTTDEHIKRVERYISTCIDRLRAMQRRVASEAQHPLAQHALAEGLWDERQAVHDGDCTRLKAIARFRPKQPVYDVIMAADIPWEKVKANDDKLRDLHNLPVYGLAGSPCIVIIAGGPHDTIEIMELMTAWGATYETIICTMHFHKVFSATKQIKQHERSPTLLFHAGSIGTAQLLNHSNQRNNVLTIRSLMFQNRKDTEFYNQMNGLLDLPARAELFNSADNAGWENLAPGFFDDL